VFEQDQAMRRRGPEKVAGSAKACLRAVQRFSQFGAAQRAAGYEQERHDAARVPLGAIVPDVVAGSDQLQTWPRTANGRGWDERTNHRPAP
jgi:hypothetical protein